MLGEIFQIDNFFSDYKTSIKQKNKSQYITVSYTIVANNPYLITYWERISTGQTTSDRFSRHTVLSLILFLIMCQQIHPSLFND